MNDFKLSKRVRILSKILGQKSALEIFGAQKLGAGVTGDVFSTKGAAVKVAKGKKDRKVLEHEANILKALGQNKSTPNLLGKGKNYLAMQKLEGGPLSKHLSRIKSDSVFAEYICRRTIEAIGSLHRKGVAQRDLHSNNIFITDYYKVKVIDFGQASNKYGDVYRETFFGTNTDPKMGALSLIGDIFQGTQSYKTYQNILKKHIEKICERKGADVKLLFTDYSSVEGDDDKEAKYFDNFEMALYPISTDNSEVRDFYNDIDRSLKINTRNPTATRNIQSRFANLSTSKNTARRINRPYKISGVIPKAEEGGVFDGPKSGYLVELHGKEVVVPYDEFIELMKEKKTYDKSPSNLAISKGEIPLSAIKKIRNDIYREILGGHLISYGVLPHTNEGIDKAKRIAASRDTWLSITDLPEYYNDIDSEIMTGKRSAAFYSIQRKLKIFYGLSDASESKQTSPVQEPTPTVEEKSVPEIEKEPVRNVNHPKLYPELQHIQPRYMWGQTGLYDLEFKSDIDRAIYYSKFSGGDNQKSTGTKEAVREWIFAVTGLNSYDDYEELRQYRDRIKEYILERVRAYPNENPIVVPPIYDGPFEFPTEDDYEEEYDEDESIIDDSFLDSIRDEEENDTEEIKEQAETAAEVLEEADNAEQEVDLSDIPDSIRKELEQVINNKKRERATPKPSSYKTNKEIFEFMKSNFLKIQGELSSINDSIQNQNNLILANTQVLISALDTVESQDSLIVAKLDAILQAFNLQNEKAKQLADEAENAAAERALEEKRDAARTFEYVDVSGNKRTGGKGGNFILKYLRSKLTRKLYRKSPKRLRNMRRRLRKLQKAPGRLKSRATKAVTSRVGGALARRMPGQTRRAVNALNKIKGLGRVRRAAGPLKYAFAGLEYSERKQAGQSDVQALSGVGGGLAGAAAGGAAGAKGGAVLGAAIGAVFGGVGAVPGAAIGAFLGGILGGIGGGFAGSKIADTVTGAKGYEQGTKDVEPGTAILHGTELVLDKDKLNPFNDVGGAIIAATMNFVGGMGPAAASVAPLIRQMAGPLMKTFDVPNVIAQTPVGGNFPTIGPSLKKKKAKKEEETGELYEAHDKSFTEKLMDFLSDPITSLMDAIKSKTTRPLDPNQIDQYTGAVSGETFNPLPGGAIGSTSGQQFEAPRDGGDRSHPGVDMIETKLADSRAPVVAYKTGVVTELNPNANAPGGIVGLDHGGGLQTRYVHVTPKSGLRKGDTVYGGQQLGNLHKYRDSRGIEQTHLHFEIYVNNELKNPTSYIQSVKNNLPAPLSDQRAKELYESETKSLPAIDSPVGTPPPSVDLGKQNVMGNKDFGATSGVGSKGYIIIPGHATGGGAPGEKEMVKALARNAYNNIKAKNPDAKVFLMDLDEKFPDNDAGWKAQKNWYTQKESEGYEILEIHLDAKGGTGKGVIVPHRELNPVEKEFARSHGAYDRDWRSKPGEKPLAAPHRGVSMFELGNVPEKMTQSVMNYMTAPLEESVLKTMSSVSPSTSQRPKFQSLQGPDNRGGTKYLVVNQQAKPSAPGVEFVPLATGRWRTKNEYNAKTLEKLRIGLGN